VSAETLHNGHECFPKVVLGQQSHGRWGSQASDLVQHYDDQDICWVFALRLCNQVLPWGQILPALGNYLQFVDLFLQALNRILTIYILSIDHQESSGSLGQDLI